MLQKNTPKNKLHDILTWIGEFTPGNKTIWVVFDEESDFSGPRTPKLSPDQVCLENRTLDKLRKHHEFPYESLFWGPPRGDGPDGPRWTAG